MQNITRLAMLLFTLSYIILSHTIAWAIPDNNGVLGATQIESLPTTLNQPVADANISALEVKPSCGNLIFSSVWFKYTPTTDQNVVIDTFTSDYDTVLTLWSGEATALEELQCNDDNTVLNFQSQLSASLTANTTYHIGVGSLDDFTVADNSGKGNLVLTIKALADLTNDNLADAIAATGDLPFTTTQSTLGASNESNELAPSCANSGGSAWYTYLAPTDGIVVFNTYGSNYDTVISLWQGIAHPMTELACNNDGNDESVQSQLSYALEAGITYRINVSGVVVSGNVLPESGLMVLNISNPPLNDDLSNAITLDSLPFADNRLTAGATNETREQFADCAVSSNSVWYAYTPATDEYVSFDTLGSDYDTVLSIWTGASQNHPLTELDCNGDAIDPEDFSQSRIALQLTAGTPYYLNVSSTFGTDGGNLQFNAQPIERDIAITEQPADQSIKSGQRVTLRVTVSGNPIRLHQWYEGAVGDISRPVGTDDNEFISEPLTATTQFWVKITNPTGSVTSRSVTVTVTDEETPSPNAIGLSFTGESIATTARFTVRLDKADGTSGNDLALQPTDTVTIAMDIAPATADQAKTADLVVAAEFLPNPAEPANSIWLMQDNQGWLPWSGALQDLPAVATRSLTASETIQVYQGGLEFLTAGQYNIYVGYRLTDETLIVYSGEPVRFTVTQP